MRRDHAPVAAGAGGRVLPGHVAWSVASSSALGRAGYMLPAPFLPELASWFGSDATALEALALGGLGFALGLLVALALEARMPSHAVYLTVYSGGGMVGGMLAAIADDARTFGAGLLLMGGAGSLAFVRQLAVRLQYRSSEALAARVNTEIEARILPAAVLIAGVTVAVGAVSVRLALGLGGVLFVADGIVAWLTGTLPDPDPVSDRPPAPRGRWRQALLRHTAGWRELAASFAMTGAFVAFWTPLALLLGSGPAVPFATWCVGTVRLLVPWILGRFAAVTGRDARRSAWRAFAWSLAGCPLLLLAALADVPVWLALALLAVGYLVIEGTGGAGWVALKTVSDRSVAAGSGGILLILAGAAGGTSAGFAIAQAGWLGAVAIGAALMLAAACAVGWPSGRQGAS